MRFDFEYKELEDRYKRDAAFNKMVNLFRQLIETYGFQASEIRQGLFFAQYTFEMNNVREIIKAEDERNSVIEKIKRLELALKKCKEHRDEWLKTDYAGDEIHQADMDKELESILEGK